MSPKLRIINYRLVLLPTEETQMPLYFTYFDQPCTFGSVKKIKYEGAGLDFKILKRKITNLDLKVQNFVYSNLGRYIL